MTNTPLKAVLFDLDGTLANTLPLCIQAFRSAIEPVIGNKLSDEEIIATFGPSEEGTIMALAPFRYEECLAAYLHHYERSHSSYPDLFEGIRALLNELWATGMRLGLVTGKGAHSTQLSLQQFGLLDTFEVIETGSPHGPRKAEALRDIIAKWNMEAEHAVYVGDAPSDIMAARAVGMPVVAAAWARTADEQALAALTPDYLAVTVSELRAWVMARQMSGNDKTEASRHAR